MSVEIEQRRDSGESDVWDGLPLSHIGVLKALRGVFERQKIGEAVTYKCHGRQVLVLGGYANIITSRLPLSVEPVSVAIAALAEYDPLTVVCVGEAAYLMDRDAGGLPRDIDELRIGPGGQGVSYTPEFIVEALSNVELSRASAQAVAVDAQLEAGASPYGAEIAFDKDGPLYRSYGPGQPLY